MAPTAADNPIRRVATDDVPEADRLALVRAAYAGAIADIDIAPLPDSAFRWHGAVRRLPGLGIASMQCSALAFARQAVPGDDLIVSVVIAGLLRLRGAGRETVVRPGEAIVVRGRDAVSGHCAADTRMIELRVPLNVLTPPGGGIDAVLGTAIAAAEPVSMLTTYADALLASHGLEQPQSLGLAVAHVREIVDLILGLARGTGKVVRARGLGAARLAAIKADIVETATSRELSIGAVAARHGVTARYVRKLFESEGLTFSAFVLDQRLARALRMLTDPRRDHETISAIAFACGFGDLSYFNRVFRRRNGATPSAVRAAARRGEVGGERCDVDEPARSICQAS
jgi:AraC-like DNA-binding protein